MRSKIVPRCGRDVDLLPVLARRQVVERLRLDRLEPGDARERGGEDDREDRDEQPEAPVRLAHPPLLLDARQPDVGGLGGMGEPDAV